MTRATRRYNGNSYQYYYCPTTKKRGCSNGVFIKEDELSECILESVKGHIKSVASLEEILAGSDGQKAVEALTKQYTTQIADNEKQLEQISGFKSMLYENMIDGTISKDEFKTLNAKYLDDISRLKSAVDKLRQEVDDVLSGKGERLKWTEHFKQFEGLSEIDRRTVSNLIQNIRVISKTELQITFNYQSEYETSLALLKREVA
jgi:hypothetical protein